MNESLMAEDHTPKPLDQSKNYLAELVGEGKKFDSNEALARGKFESDQFIETLKRQQDELRADYLKLKEESDTRAKLEELVGRLESGNQQQELNHEQPPVNDVKVPTIEDLTKQMESLLPSKFQEYETSKKQQENFNTVKGRLQERFGDNYQSVLKQQIAQLGLTEEDVNSLARKSPTAFFNTLGLNQQQNEQFQTPPRSNRISDNFANQNQQEKRTWSYYQKMKKENPNRYYDPKTNVQMHNDMMELGEDFKDGDYRVYGD